MACLGLFRRVVAGALLATVLVCSPASAEEERMTLITDVRSIAAGMRFDGCPVAIAGEAPAGSRVYVKVVGPEKTAALSRQGPGKPLWMAVETVRVHGMPAFYQVLGSDGFEIPEEVRQSTGLGPDYSSLYERARVLSRNEERAEVLPPERSRAYLDSLVRTYEERDLYRIIPMGIHINGTSYAGNLYIPPGVPRGELRLTAFAVRDGRVVARAQRTITVRSSGPARLMEKAVLEQPVAYGLTAVIMALAAGLAVARIHRRLSGQAGRGRAFTGQQ